ncbi:ABC transporter substrate-binding protein [Paenibacillus periandrae]|uniref:ABC transporter substrate-binding protein n=1 Tax=Paenibacillus periandrae TaxID=1761741 RepID=UPI001F094275|nr:ABC transporter substrate-binding protein [Paenibacillus periandrae]
MSNLLMKKSWLISFASIFTLSAVLTACGSSSTAPETGSKAASEAKVTLTYWNGFTGPDRPAYEELVKRFNDSHPNIQITMEISPWDALLAKLPTSLASGQGPDIASFDSALIPQYAKGNLILPVDDIYGKGIDPKVMAASLVDAMKYNSKLYAVPANTATLLMYYNKDLFKAAGIAAPPTTWAEWQDAIMKTTKTNGNEKQYGLVLADHATIPMWPILIWGNGGDILSADHKTSMLNDSKTVEALKIWADLVANKRISPVNLTGGDADKIFASGKAAMEINGPWMAGGLSGVNYGVAPVPSGPAGKATLANAVAMVIGKNTKHKDEVYEFMKFWNSADAQAYLSSKSGFPPTRTDLNDNPLVKSNPLIPQFAAVANDSRFYLAGMEQFSKIDSDIFTPAIQAITNNKGTVEATMADASKKLDALLSGK